MDWHAIHEYAEATETWSTIVVNLTGIFTGFIVGGRWLIRRVQPNVHTVLHSALISLILSIAASLAILWVAAIQNGLIGR